MNYSISKKVPINGKILWKHFIDTDNWHAWQQGLEYAKKESDFSIQATIKYKRNDSNQIIDIVITEIIEQNNFYSFTDSIQFPLATMISGHKITMISDQESIIELTVETSGFLSFLWDWLVVKNIIAGMPTNLDNFIDYVQKKINENKN